MAITDAVARTVVVIKGDTSDYKAKLKDLQGEEKKLAEQQLKQAEARNKQIDSQIAMLGKIGIAVGAMAGAIAVGERAWTAYAERQRLAAQAGTVDLGRLSAAAGGAKTQIQLLSDAAKLQTGAYKLSATQMEMVQRAMRQLTRETGNADEVAKRVTESIVKLEGDALKDYGIRVRSASTDSEKFAAIMEALGAKSDQLKDKNATTAESLAKVKATFGDVSDRVMQGLGRMVSSLAPFIQSLGNTVSLIGQIAEASAGLTFALAEAKVPGSGQSLLSSFTPSGMYANARALYGAAFHTQLGGVLGDASSRLSALNLPDPTDPWGSRSPSAAAVGIAIQQLKNAADPRGFEESQEAIREAAQRRIDKLYEDADEAVKAAEKASKTWKEMQERMGAAYLASIYGRRPEVERYAPAGLGSAAGPATDEFGRPLYGESQLSRIIGRTDVERLTASWNERLGKRAQQKSKLETIFGPLSDFDAYAKGFQLLTGAAQAAFTAWIDGSMSAGEAVKKFFAESLKGMASDLLGKAILHGAYAIGSLAFGDFKGATTHGIAAAKAGAGALAIGVLAKALAPGADSASGAASAGGSSGGAGVSPGGGRGGSWGLERERDGSSQVMVVVTGDPFAMDSPRARAANIRRVVGRVVKNGVSAR